MSDTTPDLPIIVKQPLWRIVLSLIGSTLVAGIAVYALIEGASPWFAWPVIIGFGLSVGYFSEKLLNPKPRITISEDGINLDYWNSGMMLWSDFAGVEARAVNKDVYLCLELRDPEAYRRRISPALRVIHTATRETGFGDLSIRLTDYFSDTTPVVVVVRRQIGLSKDKPRLASSVHYPRVD